MPMPELSGQSLLQISSLQRTCNEEKVSNIDICRSHASKLHQAQRQSCESSREGADRKSCLGGVILVLAVVRMIATR